LPKATEPVCIRIIYDFGGKELNKKIDLYILTGFLGAGKTTLLTNILNDLSEKKLGVIMNEFGRISIDGDVIRKEGLELIEINRGSIFCSCLKLNFAHGMMEMAERDLDYLFVESSGLADPSNIGDILAGVSDFKGDVYNYKGAICVVDAENFLEQLEDLETVERQIRHCHLVALSKTDLVDDDKLSEVIKGIREINQIVPIETTNYGKLDYGFLEEDLMKYHWNESEDTTNTPENKPKTIMIEFDEDITISGLESFVDSVKRDAYRIKGFARVDGDWSQIDVVGNRLHIKETAVGERPKLVVISKIGPQIIRPIAHNWENFIRTPMKMK